MAEYKAPLRDMRFVLNEVFEADKLWSSLAGLQGAVDVENRRSHSGRVWQNRQSGTGTTEP